MSDDVLKVVKLEDEAVVPRYAHPGDAGLDLFAAKSAVISPGQRKLIGTGIAIELPSSAEAQIRPRSGLAVTSGITVLNSPGTVDSEYRGEVQVLLVNHGESEFRVKPGMRIAQLVVARVVRMSVQQVSELSPSQRGHGGFGSTGE